MTSFEKYLYLIEEEEEYESENQEKHFGHPSQKHM